MKKQAIISIVVSAVVLLAGSAGSYAIHRSYSVNAGEGSLLADAAGGTELASTRVTSGSAADNGGSDDPADSSGGGADSGNATDDETSNDSAGQGGEDDGLTLKQIISTVGEKVVMIETADGSIGSGFLYNDRGDILTNAHVVAGYADVTITMSDSDQMPGTVIGIGEETDVAVVRVPDLEGVEPLELKLNAEAEVGDEVLALGSPLGLQNTVTTGIVSGVDRTFDIAPYYYEGLYQISAPIAPGNSGGPLVDRRTGQVLGINSAVTDEGGIGFSIPVISIVDSAKGWSDSPMDVLPAPDYGYDEYGLPTDEYGDDYYGDDYGYDDVPVDATELEYASEDVLYAFYDAVALQDYKTAYNLLGAEWQAKQSYKNFADGYKDTLGVYLDYCIGVENGDGTVSVYVTISADERAESGGTTTEFYDLVYQVGYEAGDASDVLKMISGKSE
ncbi:S1C family serine protease [Saccharibacillus sacchari]|uniref:S1C family serine protease n=1 Tax=Saccharibacillus sacchari TaxID=456493 RepID=UPI0004B035AC|nr:trypsin-like peptidase domain-containing protein [Saccharibacillus sacchari]